MLFYAILLWLTSHMFMVIGLGNNLPPVGEEDEGRRMLRATRSSSTGNTEGPSGEARDSPVADTEY